MRALVTGASGLIGSHIVKALLRAGHQPVAMVRPTSDLASLAAVEQHIEVVEGDVLDADDLHRFAEVCEVVFHTAVPFGYQGQVDDDVDRIAISGTENVLRAAHAHRVPRVVVTTSSVVFGYSLTPTELDESDLTQDHAYEPGYVRAKLRQHRQALRLGGDLGVHVVMACPTMTVGPESTRLGPSNAIVVQYLADPLATSYSGGINIACAEDVAVGHLRLAEHGTNGSHYLLGGDNLTWLDVHSLIADLCGVARPRAIAAPPFTYLAATIEELTARIQRRPPVATREQASMTGRYYWYSSRRAAAFGFRSRPARDSLAEAIAWLAASPHISREMRTSMTLHPDVYAARRRLAGLLEPAPEVS